MIERFHDHLITAENESGEEIKLIAPKADICEENKSNRVTYGHISHVVLEIEQNEN